MHIRSEKLTLTDLKLLRGNGQEDYPIRRGGCLHGRAVQGQPGGRVLPRGRRLRARGGCALDAVRRRRVQPLPDRLPLPRLLLPSRRRHATVPPPLVHLRHRGRALRTRDAGVRALPLHVRPRGAPWRRRVRDQVRHPDCQEGSCAAAPETEEQGKLFIELDFPSSDFVGCGSADELPSIPDTLNGAPVVSVHKSVTTNDFIVELSSGKEVADVLPNIEEIRKCAGRGVIITAPAPAGSGYDFFTRFFCPKFGVNEDPVCGSAHCVLAPYWAGKLGKQKLIAFQVSPRSGTLYLELDAASRRVRLQGEAVTVMAGTLFA